MTDRVTALRREPNIAVLVEDEGVRIAHHLVGNRILLHGAVFGIEPADVPRQISREPHEARLVDDQVVRSAPVRQLVLLELPGRRHEVGDVVARLAAEPDPVGRRIDERIAGTRIGPGYRPFFDDRRFVDNRYGNGE